MSMIVTETTIDNVLTKASGYLAGVTSHSMQPYRGCAYGRSLCGVACYVRHNPYVTQGREWGTFLEVRVNAAEAYLRHVAAEKSWAHRRSVPFSIFMSSATDPFMPQERRYGITRSLLTAMLDEPPDELLVQTHTHQVEESLSLLHELNSRCRLRVQLSIETDLDHLPGLPPPCSTVERRLIACERIRNAGIFTVATVAPLLPIENPERFFSRIATACDAVIIDHFIEGDGSKAGSRTLKTALPDAMASVDPASVTLAYRDRMIEIASRFLPGRVGVSRDGFAGRYLESS